MPRIERSGRPNIAASEAESSAGRGPERRRSLPSFCGLPGLMKRRRNSQAPQTEATVRVAACPPVPPPVPPEGFSLPRRAELRPPSGNPKLQHVAVGEAAHLGQKDPQTGVFVGTGKWDGADLPATARPNRTEPLQAHELQQAGYQLAARAIGDPIEDSSDLEHLARATQTMHDTRLDLKSGRGNIGSDVDASNGASAARTLVSTDLGAIYDANTRAGVALAYGAGNCDQNAMINSRRYAAALQGEGETVSTMLSRAVAHHWAQLNRPDKTLIDGSTEPRPAIVLDSWGNGPAVRLADFRWEAPDARATETHTQASGALALEAMNKARDAALPGGDLHELAESKLQFHTQNATRFTNQFASDSVVAAGFAKQARRALAQSALSQQLMAVAAGRSAYDLNVHEAANLSTSFSIAITAMRLDRMARPPIVTPEDQVSE
jgi:hypothetical protein